jgi:tetratricopeptide (TPR) repeat protein
LNDARLHEADALHRLSDFDAAEEVLSPLTTKMPTKLPVDRLINMGRIMGEINTRRNRYAAARRWLAPALEAAIAAEDLGAESELRCVLSRLERRVGNSVEARRHAVRWLECARAQDDLASQGEASYELAMIDWSVDREAARQGLRFALDTARETSKQVVEAQVRSALGALAIEDSAIDDAYAQLKRALTLHLETGDERFEGVTRYRLARLHVALGEVDQAKTELEMALPKIERAGDIGIETAARKLLAELDLSES